MLIPHYERGYVMVAPGAAVPYLIVGDGPVPLVLIPGAGDGLRTVYDWAEPTAWALRGRAKRYCTLVISRREPLPSGFTAEQHAGDFIRVIEELGWSPAILEGNSGGGPIAQWIAVKRPDLVRGLVLTSTLHHTGPATRAVLEHWLELARRRSWAELNWSSIEYSLSPRLIARYRPLRPLVGLLPAPKSPKRMERVFEELLDLDSRELTPRIAVPALVIGGADDRVIGPATQREMAESIPGSRLILYPGFGHYNDQENPDYLAQLDRFVAEVWPEAAARWSERPAERAGAPTLSLWTLPAGALAGFVATGPMTLVMAALFQRLPWHERRPLPPSQITSNLAARFGLSRRKDTPAHAVATTLAHFGYGSAMGAVYGVPASMVRGPAALMGVAWGLAVWAGSYLGLLPALRLLPPATEHAPRRNALMIAAHVVWGLTLGLVFAALGRRVSHE